MGNLYRFVEPVVLLLLQQKGKSYGYELSTELKRYAFTNAEIEIAALYKTLRALEDNACVTSEWVTDGSGPAKRVYALTSRGEEHLTEWVAVLTHMSGSMKRFLLAAKRSKELR